MSFALSDGSSILPSSTRTRSVELYSFSRMSSRLSINSRVANSNPRFFCLQEKQDFKNKDRACASRRCRAARHTKKKEQGTEKRRVCLWVFFVYLRFVAQQIVPNCASISADGVRTAHLKIFSASSLIPTENESKM